MTAPNEQTFIDKYTELRKDFARRNREIQPTHLYLDQEDSLAVMYDNPFRLTNIAKLKIDEVKALTESKLGLLIVCYSDVTELK